jgi:hypothetical protein
MCDINTSERKQKRYKSQEQNLSSFIQYNKLATSEVIRQ